MHWARMGAGWAKFAMVAVACLGVTGGVVATTATPALAGTCSGTSCTGKDPHATGCDATDQTRDLDAFWLGNISVEFRTNASICVSRWTRLTIDDYTVMIGEGIQIIVQRQISTPYGWEYINQYTHEQLAANGRWWTLMVAAVGGGVDRSNACYRFYPGNAPPSGTWTCTDWHY